MEEKKSTQESTPNLQLIYIVGAVFLLLVVGAYFLLSGSFEKIYSVSITNYPKEMNTSSVGSFTWSVNGPPTTIKTTAIRYGTVSNPGDLGKDVKPADTKYTDFTKEFANGTYSVPLVFIANLQVPKTGTYYFRIYALVDNKNYWSPEYTFSVKPAEYKVSMMVAPTTVIPGTISTFTWRVDGDPTTIPSTTIYFGLESKPGDLGKDVTPADTTYKYSIPDFIKGTYNIPLQFVGNIKVNKAGTYYYRLYANIKDQNYWGPEQSFEAK